MSPPKEGGNPNFPFTLDLRRAAVQAACAATGPKLGACNIAPHRTTGIPTMRHHSLSLLTMAALAMGTGLARADEACLQNFSAEGSLFSGKTYKTSATFAAVAPQDAFSRAYAFTVQHGFTVVSSDKSMGIISAAQSVSYGKGKTVPLNIVVAAEQGGSKVAMMYATGAGVMSPEDAIKKHFCLTLAAVAGGTSAGTDSPAPAAAEAAPPQARRAAPRQIPGLASITPEQREALARELPKNVSDAKIRASMQAAAPTIKEFVERLSCMADGSAASSLNVFAVPGVNLGNAYVGLRPMRSTPYHDKSSCLTVSRIHGWSAPALNALRFEVVYVADDSGESTKTKHELIRQPDGAWLFSGNYY